MTCTICNQPVIPLFRDQGKICVECAGLSIDDLECAISEPGKHCDEPGCMVGGGFVQCPNKPKWWVTIHYKMLKGPGSTGPHCDKHADEATSPAHMASFGPAEKRPLSDMAYYAERMKIERGEN